MALASTSHRFVQLVSRMPAEPTALLEEFEDEVVEPRDAAGRDAEPVASAPPRGRSRRVRKEVV